MVMGPDVESQSHHHGPSTCQGYCGWGFLARIDLIGHIRTRRSNLINNWCQWSSPISKTNNNTYRYLHIWTLIQQRFCSFNQYLLIQNNFFFVEEIFVSTLHFLNFLTVLALMILWAESVTHILICPSIAATLKWTGCSLNCFLFRSWGHYISFVFKRQW